MSALSCPSNNLSRQNLVAIQPYDQQKLQAPSSQQQLQTPSLAIQPVPYPSLSYFHPMSIGLVKDLQLFSPESISSVESPRYIQSMYSDQSTLFDTRYHGSDYEGSISFGSGAASLYDHIPSTSGVYQDESSHLATGFYSPAPTVLDSGDEIKSNPLRDPRYESTAHVYSLAHNSQYSNLAQYYDSFDHTQNCTSDPSSLHLDSHAPQQSSPQLPQSPAISSSSMERPSARRTRSGLRRKLSTPRTIDKGDTPNKTSVTASSPTGIRKRRASSISKGDKPKVPKLVRPLSELTKEYTHLPIKNMETWVTRSLEERRHEVEKRNGYITRPMNSFMLYRSAYAERTKFWCLQNNHQVVSSVSGASWPLEPPEIRDRYNAYAKLERINHSRAHPGYKFSPAKVQPIASKVDATAEENDDDDLSGDIEDINVEPGKVVKARKREKNPTERGPGFTEHAAIPMAEYEDNLDVESSGGALKSSYETLNPGRTAPTCMGNADMNGLYYQTIVRPTSGVKLANAMIEDVTIKKTAAPAGQSNLRRDLQDRLLISSIDNATADTKVDPMLLEHSNETYLANGEFNEEDHEYAFDLKYYTNLHLGASNFETDPLFHTGSLNPTYTYLPDGAKNANGFASYNDDAVDEILDHHRSWSDLEDFNRTQDDAGHHVNIDDWLE